MKRCKHLNCLIHKEIKEWLMADIIDGEVFSAFEAGGDPEATGKLCIDCSDCLKHFEYSVDNMPKWAEILYNRAIRRYTKV